MTVKQLFKTPEVTAEIEAFEDRLEILCMQASKEQTTMNLEQQHMFHSVYNNIMDASETGNLCQPVFIEG